LSIQRADAVSEAAVRPAEFAGAAAVPANDGQVPLPLVAAAAGNATDYEECLACQ
jgi:hypothetical protein